MFRLWKDPRGEKIFTHDSDPLSAGVGTGIVGTGVNSGDEKVNRLEKQVRDLQREVQKYKVW